MDNKTLKKCNLSLRISKEQREKLDQIAKKKDVSLNSLLNSVIDDYIIVWRWNEILETMIVTYQTFSNFIDCCSDEEIEEIAKVSGTEIAKSIFKTIKFYPTLKNLLEFIKLSEKSNWFTFHQQIRGQQLVLTLHHKLTKKWSLFLSKQCCTLFKSILDLDANCETLSHSATVSVKISQSELESLS